MERADSIQNSIKKTDKNVCLYKSFENQLTSTKSEKKKPLVITILTKRHRVKIY